MESIGGAYFSIDADISRLDAALSRAQARASNAASGINTILSSIGRTTKTEIVVTTTGVEAAVSKMNRLATSVNAAIGKMNAAQVRVQAVSGLEALSGKLDQLRSNLADVSEESAAFSRRMAKTYEAYDYTSGKSNLAAHAEEMTRLNAKVASVEAQTTSAITTAFKERLTAQREYIATWKANLVSLKAAQDAAEEASFKSRMAAQRAQESLPVYQGYVSTAMADSAQSPGASRRYYVPTAAEAAQEKASQAHILRMQEAKSALDEWVQSMSKNNVAMAESMSQQIRAAQYWGKTAQEMREATAAARAWNMEADKMVMAGAAQTRGVSYLTTHPSLRANMASSQLGSYAEQQSAMNPLRAATMAAELRKFGTQHTATMMQAKVDLDAYIATQKEANLVRAEVMTRGLETFKNKHQMVMTQAKIDLDSYVMAQKEANVARANIMSNQIMGARTDRLRQAQEGLRSYAQEQFSKNSERAVFMASDLAKVQESKVDQVTKSMKNMGSEAERGFNKATTAGKSFNDIASRIQRTISAFIAVVAFQKLIFGFQSLVRTGVHFNQMMEDTKLSIGSMLFATQEFYYGQKKVTDGTVKFAAAQVFAADIQKELQIENLKTAATYEQLMAAYTQAMTPGAAAKFTEPQTREFTVGFVKAAQAMAIPMDQLGEEVRSMLTGSMQRRMTRIMPYMEAMGMTNMKIRAAAASGKLFEAVMRALEPAIRMGEKALDTFTNRLSNLKDALSLGLGKAFEGAFETLKTKFLEWSNMIVTIDTKTRAINFNEAFLKPFQYMDAAIVSLINNFTAFLRLLNNFSSQFPNFGKLASDFGAIGISIVSVLAGTNLLTKALKALVIAFSWIVGGKAMSGLWDIVKSMLGFTATVNGTAVGTRALIATMGKLNLVFAAFSTIVASVSLIRMAGDWEIYGKTVKQWASEAWLEVRIWWENMKIEWPTVTKVITDYFSTLKSVFLADLEILKSAWNKFLEGMKSGWAWLKENAKNASPFSGLDLGAGLGSSNQTSTSPYYGMGDFRVQERIDSQKRLSEQSLREANAEQEKRALLSKTLVTKGKQRQEDLYRQLSMQPKDMPKEGKGGGAAPHDYESQFDKYEKDIRKLTQSAADEWKQYYIDLAEFSGQHYQAEEMKIGQWYDAQIFQATEASRAIQEEIDRLDKKIAKGALTKAGVEPGTMEHIAQLKSQLPSIVALENERKNAITAQRDLKLEIAKIKGPAQEAQELAEVALKHAELVGLLEEQVYWENYLAGIKATESKVGKSAATQAIIDQNAAIEARRNLALKGDSFRGGFGQAASDAARTMPTFGQMGSQAFEKLSSAINDTSDALSEFVMTGTMDFGNFAKSIVRDMLKIFIQWQMMQLMFGNSSSWANGAIGGGFVGAIMKLFSSGATAGITGGVGYSSSGVGSIMGLVDHNGRGTVSRLVPASYFFQAPRLHSGLMADEFPAILQKGEKVIPKGQSEGSESNIQVNLINNTSEKIEKPQIDVKRDGDRMVLSVVLNAMQKNEKFRNQMNSYRG